MAFGGQTSVLLFLGALSAVQVAFGSTVPTAHFDLSLRSTVPSANKQCLRLKGGQEAASAHEEPAENAGPGIPVKFEVSVHHLRPKGGPAVKCGEIPYQVMLVGSVKELGEWNVEKGIELTPSSQGFPLFQAIVHLLPGSKVEYKYVIVRAQKTSEGIQSQWEANNRQLSVASNTMNVRNEFIENRVTDPRITEEPFQLTAQEWSRWYKHHVTVN